MAQNFLYSSRDHKFILKEWLDMDRILNYSRFKETYSLDDVDVILGEALKGAKEKVAPSNDFNDDPGAVYKDGKVYVPKEMGEAYHFIQENGWGSINQNLNYEAVLPHTIYEAVLEYVFGANEGLACYYMACAGSAELIDKFGNEKLRELYMDKVYWGEWSGTMCLTEPSAGSDVGDMLTKAYPTETPGVYKIKGTKCFITGGEQDFTENIVHLLLARIEGSRPGTSGLSLFVVPKFLANDDGSLGARNDVQCLGIEHKMGMRGSATCVMSFGEEGNCTGYLLGEVPGEDGRGNGMAQMFNMMNGARLEMGVGSTAAAAVAFHNSAQYASERVQGKALTNPKGGRVALIKHEDIKRMLIDQKAHIEVMRALCAQTYYFMDIALNDDDPAEAKKADAKLNIMTPICKAYNSDMSWDLCAEAMQIYGGYGYTEEYPIAQLCRDTKIHSIWEGTNFIQAMATVGRSWTMAKGQAFGLIIEEIEDIIKKHADNQDFVRELAIVKEAFDAYTELKNEILKHAAAGRSDLMGLYATRILHATAKLYGGALILDQAVVARAKIEELGKDHYDYAFYQGKVESAKYYVRNIVPEVGLLRDKILDIDSSAIDINEEALTLL